MCKHDIQRKDNAVPYAVNTPRRIALLLRTKVKDKLVELERQGVISKVDQPTDWCAPVVAVPKSNGDIRVCIDLTKLNDQVKQETLVLPSIDNVVSQLSNAKLFSKLDANSGFYQIEITPELALLKTFITTLMNINLIRLASRNISLIDTIVCLIISISTLTSFIHEMLYIRELSPSLCFICDRPRENQQKGDDTGTLF